MKKIRILQAAALVLFVSFNAGMAQTTNIATPASANHPPDYIKPVPHVILPIWPNTPPNLVLGGRLESIKNERFADVSIPQILVYLPPKENANGTALLIFAGGGYGGLAMCLHVENVVKMLNDRGVAVIGVKYRTEYGNNDVVADAMADGKRALKLVQQHAKEWNINPDRVGIQGYSAGANLCLNILGHFDEGNPQSEDSVERYSSRPDFCLLMSTWPHGKPLEAYPLAQNAPPTWIASALDDTTAPFVFSQGIYDKLKSLKVPVEMFTVEEGGHGAFHYGMAKGPGSQWPKPLFEWLENSGMLVEK